MAENARALDFGDEANDGVRANVEAFAKLIETGAAQPPPLVPMAHASLGDKVQNIARVSINLGKSKLHPPPPKNVHAPHAHVSAHSHARAPVMYL